MRIIELEIITSRSNESKQLFKPSSFHVSKQWLEAIISARQSLLEILDFAVSIFDYVFVRFVHGFSRRATFSNNHFVLFRSDSVTH